jgi:hypothetical protein
LDTAKGPIRIHGRDHYRLGEEAARADGIRARMLVKLAARMARRRKPAGRPWADETLARVEGSARVLSMSGDDLLSAMSVLEPLMVRGCSNFGAMPPATRGDDVMVSWNFDAFEPMSVLIGRYPLYVREIDGLNPYVCFGNPVLFGIGVMNVKGLCCAVNAVGVLDDGEGMSPFEMNNLAMENCGRVDEAAAIFEAGPRGVTKGVSMAMFLNWNTIWADLDGSMAVFEYSHNYFNKQPAGEKGVIASTNHHQFLDQSKSGNPTPEQLELFRGSYSRLGRMYSLLAQYHGEIDPKVAKLIISDHMPDYSLLKGRGVEREWWQRRVDNATICAHPWNMWRHILAGEIGEALEEMTMSATLYSMQMQPRSGIVWFTKGRPCRNATTPMWFGGMLGMECEKPEAIEPAAGHFAAQRNERSGIMRDGMNPSEELLEKVWLTATDIEEKGALKKLEG